jgi:hypothetical protein
MLLVAQVARASADGWDASKAGSQLPMQVDQINAFESRIGLGAATAVQIGLRNAVQRHASPEMNIKKHFQVSRTFIASLVNWMLLLCAIFLLYVLSIGPSYRAVRTKHMQSSTFIEVYDPILLDYDKYPRLVGAKDWYESLWYDEGEAMMRSITAQLASPGYSIDATDRNCWCFCFYASASDHVFVW